VPRRAAHRAGDRWAADLEDELLAQLFLLGLEGVVQLFEATLAEGVVRRPVGLVEGASGRIDGPVHLGRRRIGHLPDDLFGRRVDVAERSSGVGVDQLSVDEHPRFRVDLHFLGHGTLPLVARIIDMATACATVATRNAGTYAGIPQVGRVSDFDVVVKIDGMPVRVPR
jgi:hypothetical protein